MRSQLTPPESLLRRHLLGASLASFTLALSGCGGGESGGIAGVGSGGTGSFSVGTIRGFGSVIVNNVRYDDTVASVLDDAGAASSNARLRLGMVVEVNGTEITTDATGVRRASASAISYRSEIEGPISALNPASGTLTVLGQPVRVTTTTVFDDSLSGGLASLAVGQVVEIYGLLDSTGTYTATRIEREDSPRYYKLRGVVSDLDTTAQTLRIGAAVIAYGEIAGTVAGLSNGKYARVELQTVALPSGQWRAIRLNSQGVGSTVPSARVNAELEGFITAFTRSTLFSVNGVSVDASGVAQLPAGLALGSRVEIKGVLVNNQLTAREVELEDANGNQDSDSDQDDFEVEGNILSVNTSTQTLLVRGVTVRYASASFEDGTVANLVLGVKVEVKGSLSADGTTLIARTVKFDD